MNKYCTPDKYYLRLHHVRPRFKNDVERVLNFVSFGIVDIGERPTKDFNKALDDYIKTYGQNACCTLKTVQNWRTEIAALFGMYIEIDGMTRPTFVSVDLANNSDLIRFFRNFIYSFQYPGGHVAARYAVEFAQKGIEFHPGQWLAKFLLLNNDSYITKAEFCHCVLNDLRVTRDHEPVEDTYHRIIANRKNGVGYDMRGDVVRYAGDILDYCVLANLIVEDSNGRYFPNNAAIDYLDAIRKAKNFFLEYKNIGDVSAARKLEPHWVLYVENCYKSFTQSINSYLSKRKTSPKCKTSSVLADDVGADSAAKIGEDGENLIHSHEIRRICKEGRKDLKHLIKRIPTHFAMGYDVKSVEIDETLRAIEVKTTKSKAALNFNRIHLTTNEWVSAESLRDKYYVYRLQISDEGHKLFLLQDPVGKYKKDMIKMIPRDGADILFEHEAGQFVDLLCND